MPSGSSRSRAPTTTSDPQPPTWLKSVVEAQQHIARSGPGAADIAAALAQEAHRILGCAVLVPLLDEGGLRIAAAAGDVPPGHARRAAVRGAGHADRAVPALR